MLFDTLQLSKDLQESFSPQQSETLARVLAQAGNDRLATKADIAAVRSEVVALRAELKGEISETRAELKSEISETRAELKSEISETRAELKSEISETRTELKSEISETRTELKNELAELRAELKSEISETKSGTASLEARIAKELSLLRADTIRWIVTAIAFNFLATAGLIVGLVKFFGK